MKFANFFIFVFYCTKRRCSQIKQQLKVEKKGTLKAYFSKFHKNQKLFYTTFYDFEHP